MALSDEKRAPLLDERGARTLKNLLEHPHAPKWNYACGDMLSRDDLAQVRAYENALQAPPFFRRGELPDWLPEFVEKCQRDVPFYRDANAISSTRSDFFALPTTSRRDLARAPWRFVPDTQSLDEMVMYSTSGTTSAAMPILSHPRASSCYLPFLRKALRLGGVNFSIEENTENRIAVALVCAQKKTLTYASVSSFLGNAGFVKINLHADDWRDRDDRIAFLESGNPQILTGDPLSFWELMQLVPSLQPRALVSSATTLSPALKMQLETHFGCPVFDVYACNEAGILASSTRNGVFEVLPHDIYLEILRENGDACEPNEIGEIVVSGGRNPFLPLLRYRTGDFARLEFDESGRRFLRDFTGRAPVLFRDGAGEVVSSIDVAAALRLYATTVFAFSQERHGDIALRLPHAIADENALRDALQTLFGGRSPDISHDENVTKTVYSSELTF